MNPKIFKAYDIRGVYPEDISSDTIYKIGRAFVKHLKAQKVAVGRDARESSPQLFESLKRGMLDQGADVVDLGICTTPMVYFASGKIKVDGALMLTASHNPPEWNGLKLCRAEAVPIGEGSGMEEIRRIATENIFYNSPRPCSVTNHNIKAEYFNHIAKFLNLGKKHFKIVVDPANAMGVLDLSFYKKFPGNISLITINDKLDGTFPSHEPNPLKIETLKDLMQKVLSEKADLGIASDGDGDRIGFVDEKGKPIPMDLITALLAKIELEKKPGAKILYDLRSSVSVREIIEENGGIAHECRVGHALIKKQMRDEGAVFAGELSGHYYFQENFLAEACPLPAVYLLNLMAKTGKPISELVAKARRYYQSGEINSEVGNKEEVLARLKKAYPDGELGELDGIKISYWKNEPGARWWFSVRPSNTEPLLRLNLEADNQKLMESKKTEVMKIIRS